MEIMKSQNFYIESFFAESNIDDGQCKKREKNFGSLNILTKKIE